MVKQSGFCHVAVHPRVHLCKRANGYQAIHSKPNGCLVTFSQRRSEFLMIDYKMLMVGIVSSIEPSSPSSLY